MPLRENVVIGGTKGYRLRHIGPQSVLWPNPPALISTYPVLGQPAMISRPLPAADVPGTPDFEGGQWNARLLDAGDGQVNFPNGIAADDIPWRDRFQPDGHNQWLEVYNDSYLETVLCILQVNRQMPAVTVQGMDGFAMCKSAFERDWTVLQAPRDVIERGTQLWVPLVVDDFSGGVLNGQWLAGTSGGGTVAMASGSADGCVLSVPAGLSTLASSLKAPTAAADVATIGGVGTGTLSWANPSNAKASDGKFASATNASQQSAFVSHWLSVTGFFGSLPTGAGYALQGIVVNVHRKAGGLILDSSVRLQHASTLVGTDKANTSTLWTGSGTTNVAYGASNTDWGSGLSLANLNDANFGVAFAVQVGTSGTAYVDYISVTVYYTQPAGLPSASITSVIPANQLNSATGVWSATTEFQSNAATSATPGLVGSDSVALSVLEDNGDQYTVQCTGTTAKTSFIHPNGSTLATVTPSSSVFYQLALESDGDNVFAFVNGRLVGCCRRKTSEATTTTLQMEVALTALASTTAATITVLNALQEAQQSHLQRGSDKGDYVLPGDITTYPIGGLHARYFNNLDLASDNNRLLKIHTPPRTQAYSGASTWQYNDQQDPTIAGQANPTPGAAASGWSVIWFGSVYLKLSQGDYQFSIVMPAHANNQAVRAWVGQTQLGTHLVDQWGTAFNNTSSQAFTFTVSAAALAGTLGYGGGTVQRDGYYPIKIEYAVDSTATFAPVLELITSPAAYTDPGGTSIPSGTPTTSVAAGSNGVNVNTFTGTQTLNAVSAAPYPTSGLIAVATGSGFAVLSYSGTTGTTFTNCKLVGGVTSGVLSTGGLLGMVVPSTSLSPLGMADQRYQGQAHFDMVQQTAQSYDYQFTVEPQRLESGLFPGVLAPRIREGYDTEAIYEPDTDDRKEGFLNYSYQEDASDFAASLQGNGAGFQSGSTGQLQSKVFDVAAVNDSLFDVQGWQDFSDAAYGSLLQALLNSELSLRVDPWTLIGADPTGRERLARSTPAFPLPQNLWGMRLRPGDGLRLRARDVALWDTIPRQMLTVQRNFAPLGATGVTVGWANRSTGRISRARTRSRVQRRMNYSLTRLQRNYQKTTVGLSGDFVDGVIVAAASTSSQKSVIALTPGDQVRTVYVRVGYNSGGLAFTVFVNGVDETADLNGPWTGVPTVIDLGAVAGPDSNNQIYVQVHNNGGSSGLFSWQAFAEVLR